MIGSKHTRWNAGTRLLIYFSLPPQEARDAWNVSDRLRQRQRGRALDGGHALRKRD